MLSNSAVKASEDLSVTYGNMEINQIEMYGMQHSSKHLTR